MASWFAETRKVPPTICRVTRWTWNWTISSCSLCHRGFWYWFWQHWGERSWHSVSIALFWSSSKHQLIQDSPHQCFPLCDHSRSEAQISSCGFSIHASRWTLLSEPTQSLFRSSSHLHKKSSPFCHCSTISLIYVQDLLSFSLVFCSLRTSEFQWLWCSSSDTIEIK